MYKACRFNVSAGELFSGLKAPPLLPGVSLLSADAGTGAGADKSGLAAVSGVDIFLPGSVIL